MKIRCMETAVSRRKTARMNRAAISKMIFWVRVPSSLSPGVAVVAGDARQTVKLHRADTLAQRRKVVVHAKAVAVDDLDLDAAGRVRDHLGGERLVGVGYELAVFQRGHLDCDRARLSQCGSSIAHEPERLAVEIGKKDRKHEVDFHGFRDGQEKALARRTGQYPLAGITTVQNGLVELGKVQGWLESIEHEPRAFRLRGGKAAPVEFRGK